MKKQIIFLLVAIVTVAAAFAQSDNAMRKAKTPTVNVDPPPYNPIPPVDLSSAPKDANFFEISISKTGTINGRGIKSGGVRGCDNCNVAGKIVFPVPLKDFIDNIWPMANKIDGALPRCCKTNCCCLKNNADGKVYELPLNSDGTFNGNVPEGEYTMIYAGNIIATKCGVRGNPKAQPFGPPKRN